MSTKSITRISARVWHLSLGGVLLTAGGLVENGAFAQPTTITNPNNILANPAPTPPVQSEWQQEQPDEMNVFQEAGQGEQNPVPQIFRFGPVNLHPHADYSISYADGLQASPGDRENTMIQSISTGLRFDLGSHWTLEYTPTFQFYSNSKFTDSVNHSITLNGGVRYGAWVFGLSHNTLIETAPTAATASQIGQESYITSLSASRPITSKLSTSLGLTQTITSIDGGDTSYEWSTLDWLYYTFWPRLNAGIGAGGGYDLVNGPAGSGDLDQYFEQMQAQVSWRALDKVSFSLNGGFEYTQFASPGSSDELSPTFGASIQYLPFQHTQIALTASRGVSPSDFYNEAQLQETTVVSVGLTQELFRNFTLGLTAAYSTVDYSSSIANHSFPNRMDNDVILTARISHPFFKRGNWSVYYQYSDNKSTAAGYSFICNQTGFDVSYGF